MSAADVIAQKLVQALRATQARRATQLEYASVEPLQVDSDGTVDPTDEVPYDPDAPDEAVSVDVAATMILADLTPAELDSLADDLAQAALELDEASVELDERLAAAEEGLAAAGDELAEAQEELTAGLAEIEATKEELAPLPGQVAAAVDAADQAVADARYNGVTYDQLLVGALNPLRTVPASQYVIAASAGMATSATDTADGAELRLVSIGAGGMVNGATPIVTLEGPDTQANVVDLMFRYDFARGADLMGGLSVRSVADDGAQAILSSGTISLDVKHGIVELRNVAVPAGVKRVVGIFTLGVDADADVDVTMSSFALVQRGVGLLVVDGTAVVRGKIEAGSALIGEAAIGSAQIAQLDVSKLVALEANIAEAVVQKIAAQTANIQRANVANLFVTGTATLNEAVVEKLWAEVVKAKFLTVTEKIITKDVIATGAVTARSLAAEALYGKEIKGGYIEAPIIASSEALGQGANVLADPDFVSQINTAWVASGHLGDSAASWDDTHNSTWQGTSSVGSSGLQVAMNATVRTMAQPVAQRTGSIMFSNRSVYATGARTVTTAPAGTSASPYQLTADLALTQHPGLGQRATQAPTTRVSYLTNSAVIQFKVGEPWRLQLSIGALNNGSALPSSVATVSVEFIDASTGAVLQSVPVPAGQLDAQTGIDVMVTPVATASVKMRIRSAYTRGATSLSRSVRTGSATVRTRDSSGAWAVRNTISLAGWLATHEPAAASWGEAVTAAASTWPAHVLEPLGPPDWAGMELVAQSASLSQVSPVKGWMLDPENGLRFFNSIGAQTGKLDGEKNYLSGTFATNPTGERVELSGRAVAWYDSSGARVQELGVDGGKVTHSFGVPIRRSCAGRPQLTTTEANERVSLAVTFPTGNFDATPAVVTTVESSYPQNIHSGVTSVSSTGFTAWLFRDTKGTTRIQWIASQ